MRVYCAGLAIAAAAIAVTAGLLTPLPAAGSVIVLAALFAFAENASVELPNKSSLSASLMLAMAAIVAFSQDSPFIGPVLVATAGSLYFPQLRAKEWAKVSFNLANFALSTLAAAAVHAALPIGASHSVALELLAAVPTALTYSTVNSALLIPAVSMLTQRSVRAVAREMWLGDVQILPFALLGVLLGRLYIDLGAWVVPLFVAPILIARQAFASYLALRSAQEATISTLIRALEAKDRYTAGHVERVARFAHVIGLELGMRAAALERLRYAALMHDIGKLVVPNHILNKPGKLTEAEYERLRDHEGVSVELLRRIDFLAPIAPSLEAESAHRVAESPLEARIISVADAFDAMTSTRAYRRALPQDVAIAELRDKTGTQFDGECVEALIRRIERGGEQYGDGHETDVADFAVPPPTVGTGSAGLGDLASEEQGVRS
jgi:5'-deoxynucleotidase YfbR-like HD superfamily hydrolase